MRSIFILFGFCIFMLIVGVASSIYDYSTLHYASAFLDSLSLVAWLIITAGVAAYIKQRETYVG